MVQKHWKLFLLIYNLKSKNELGPGESSWLAKRVKTSESIVIQVRRHAVLAQGGCWFACTPKRHGEWVHDRSALDCDEQQGRTRWNFLNDRCFIVNSRYDRSWHRKSNCSRAYRWYRNSRVEALATWKNGPGVEHLPRWAYGRLVVAQMQHLPALRSQPHVLIFHNRRLRDPSRYLASCLVCLHHARRLHCWNERAHEH